ncbi:HlyD family efflux transporter periplasmic adaptor subunit [Succinimonas amylolytica]|uniref:HlyD family efflux transporter periplasmic adaptor subunit n=1 Tax=Succinimonas amylolytica TaxID=83769 RepID=UPI00036BE7D1|nr:HlyD family efflux transporter periplasmic adaptor subunit [Succinimonas amylolytica]
MKNSSRDSVGILKWRSSSVSAFFILFFITLVFILGVVWSFSARITERVQGEGITLLSGGIRTVYAQGNGLMTNLNVKTGSLITQDEIIGIIHNSEDYQKYVLKRNGPPGGDSGDIRLFYDRYWLRSPLTGKVIEIFQDEGTYVKSGDPVAIVASSPEEGIYLLAVFSAENSKRIRAGMSAFFSPREAPPSRYGYIRGVVREISGTPVNQEAIVQELSNESLGRELSRGRAMYRAVIQLVPDRNHPSGYSWTSGQEFRDVIENGVMGEVTVNVEYKPPIAYILPHLADVLGLR